MNWRTAIIVAAAGLLWLARPAYAQLLGCSCVSDPPTETATGDIDGVQLPNIELALTTPGGSGIYQSAGQYIDQLSQTMGANVTGTIQSDFPGEEVLPPDTMPVLDQIVPDALNTYYNAWTVADQIEGNMDQDASALANIEQVNSSLGGAPGSASLLAAVQLVVESNLHVAQELQYTNELLSVEIKMHAFEHAEQLNEKSQAEITEATASNWGSTPR